MSSRSHDEFATPIGDFICASLVPGYSCAKIQSNIDGDHDSCDTKCCITGSLFPVCCCVKSPVHHPRTRRYHELITESCSRKDDSRSVSSRTFAEENSHDAAGTRRDPHKGLDKRRLSTGLISMFSDTFV